MIPGHVRASINWNNLKFANSDNYSPTIMDGAKVVVCRLKSNPNELYKYCISQTNPTLVHWSKERPSDEEGMEEAVLDKKIKNVLGVMGWDLSQSKRQ